MAMRELPKRTSTYKRKQLNMSASQTADQILEHANVHRKRAEKLAQHLLPLSLVQLMIAVSVACLASNDQLRLAIIAAIIQLTLLGLQTILGKISRWDSSVAAELEAEGAALSAANINREEEES
ncbi:hypothetical protein ABIB48_002614 [Arthrobacter sp. UYCu511]|uniref:hypothetical protein n=1 Tax=Arthrobacter sp. UYCu511 TaxID=3156337 RepID=UPI00339AA6D4